MPTGWNEKTIGEVAEVATGTTPPTADSSNYGDEFLFVSPADIGESKWIDSTGKRLSPKGFAISRRFPSGSVLFVCIGSTIGKCAIAKVELSSNQQINAILPNSTFDSEFLYYGLSRGASAVKAQAGEQAVPLVNKTQFAATKLVFPPLSEQRIIAAALSDVDALIAGLERLIAKKRDIKQAAMQQLLTGQTRLPGFSGEWVVRRMGDISEISMGRTPPRLNAAFWGPGNVWLSISDLHGKVIAESKEQITDLAASTMAAVPKGTLLMSFKLSIGRLCFAGTDLYTNEAICAFTNLTANAEFLYYALGHVDFSLYGKQAVKGYTLNKQSLALVEVSLPDLDEQTAIATVLSDMDADLAALESRLAKTRAIKQGMMQELLTGRTRLI